MREEIGVTAEVIGAAVADGRLDPEIIGRLTTFLAEPEGGAVTAAFAKRRSPATFINICTVRGRRSRPAADAFLKRGPGAGRCMRTRRRFAHPLGI